MKMGKTKIAVSLAALLMATGVLADENEIKLSASVDSKAVVGFSDVSASDATGSVFVDDSENDISFGSINPGETHDSVTKQIYVLTNNEAGVSMQIDDTANSGNLKHATRSDEIGMSYSFDGSAITLGNAFTIADGINLGSSSVGDMVFTPAKSAANIASGDYGTTLTVTISAN